MDHTGAGKQTQRDPETTLYVGNLDMQVSEKLLYELFLQAAPVREVYVPRDRVTGDAMGYGFVGFHSSQDTEYAMAIMNMVRLYGRPMRINMAGAGPSDRRNVDVGATLHIGNLDPLVDDKLLYDTFSAFGQIVQLPKLAVDPESGEPKGFAFLSFASFAASDAAIDAMAGQYLMNRPISVNYAFKKDGKGERHGSAAERLLAEAAAEAGKMDVDRGVQGPAANGPNGSNFNGNFRR